MDDLETYSDMDLRSLLHQKELSIWDRHDIEAELQKREARPEGEGVKE